MLNALNLKQKHKIFSTPKTDLEHRTAHNSDHAVLNVFETRDAAYNFDLKFDNPVVVSMISGKKIMHLRSKNDFEFLPGETIVMPTNELMSIDFPEASRSNPTQCMALEISNGFVRQTLNWLNEQYPKVDDGQWDWSQENFHFSHNFEIQNNINRLINVMVSDGFGKELKASNTTKELIAFLMQTHARQFLLSNYSNLSTRNRLAYIVEYIRKNIRKKLSVSELADKACLSRAQFYRAFQRELGETPVQFINRERLELAKQHFLAKDASATDVCYYAGFASLNYFSRIFKKYEGVSPTVWKKKQLNRIYS
ncbi:MAG: helix-turn-helix domain-containing protein [Cryomorphaceae bacterium]|nr:AraC family transcriptional regulator [Flavobacteriales bacterium]